MSHVFLIRCHNGGGGWGTTGDFGINTSGASSIIEAKKEVAKSIPGGWSYIYIGESDKIDSNILLRRIYTPEDFYGIESLIRDIEPQFLYQNKGVE